MSRNRRSFGGSHVFQQNIFDSDRIYRHPATSNTGYIWSSALYSVRDSCTLQTSEDEWFRRISDISQSDVPGGKGSEIRDGNPTHGPLDYVYLALG